MMPSTNLPQEGKPNYVGALGDRLFFFTYLIRQHVTEVQHRAVPRHDSGSQGRRGVQHPEDGR